MTPLASEDNSWSLPEVTASHLQEALMPAFVINARHEVVLWNAACERFSGIGAAEILGTRRHWAGFYLEERPTMADLMVDDALGDAGRFYRVWRRTVLVPGGVQGESWLANAHGSGGYFQFTAVPVVDANGRVTAVIETVEDITARKSAEDQLRTLSWAVEQSPSLVVITDISGKIEYVNRKFEEVTGYQREEAVGQNPRLLKSGLMSEELYRELWRTILAGEEWRGELQNKKKNGEIYWETITVSPVKDEDGNLSHFIALLEDVTESRALTQALSHSQKMEALGTLTGGVAHDFNNILTAIIGYANLIQMKLPSGDTSHPFLEKLVCAAEKATSLTRGLLTYSRSHAISPSPIDLNGVVGRVGKLIGRVAGEGISVSVSLSVGPLTVFADSGQVEQLLMNLARNSAEAMSGTGTLTIETSPFAVDDSFLKCKGFGVAGSYALLKVSDNGPGLDEKTRERIFEPFFTTHATGGGVGLGLSIVYGIVKQHKGYIEVESALGQGSTFSVYLPLLP